ncbi:phage BR0599 family protein [Mesorhizobium sp. M0050]|uniref:baseplate hub domain-containing protein n=1 Tax=Mesorhizobium sp. M0050 TaxID=2956861 RepID=UPI00333A0BCD
MSYDTPEASTDDGEPYFLYLFNNGVAKRRFTSDAEPIMADPEETGTPQKWFKSAIAHTEIEQTGNIERNSVDITFPLSDDYARTLQKPGSEVVTVTIWRGHHTDPDGELEVFWKGRVVDTVDQKLNIKVTVELASTSMRRTGCRAQYMRPCRHALYFTGCNLNVDDWKIPATVSAVTGGLLLTVAEAAAETDQWYKGGLVIFDGLYGWVGDHDGDQLTLIASGIEGLAEEVAAHGSAAVFIAPGCDLSSGPTGCEKFDNNLEYGGFEFMADVNPFSQSIT